MYRILVSLLIINFFSFTHAHPVHITVVNIEPNITKAVFEVSFKIFTDDFEAAVFQKSGIHIGLTQNKPHSQCSELMKDYLVHEFNLYINDKAIPHNKIRFIKYSVVEDATWVYMEFQIPWKIKNLSIYNNLLNSLYPDMTNLVIINWGNSEQGFTFTKNNTTQKIQ